MAIPRYAILSSMNYLGLIFSSSAWLEKAGIRSNKLVHPYCLRRVLMWRIPLSAPTFYRSERIITGSITKNTIVDDNSSVTGVTLGNSLIGQGCPIKSPIAPSIVADCDDFRDC